MNEWNTGKWRFGMRQLEKVYWKRVQHNNVGAVFSTPTYFSFTTNLIQINSTYTTSLTLITCQHAIPSMYWAWISIRTCAYSRVLFRCRAHILLYVMLFWGFNLYFGNLTLKMLFWFIFAVERCSGARWSLQCAFCLRWMVSQLKNGHVNNLAKFPEQFLLFVVYSANWTHVAVK